MPILHLPVRICLDIFYFYFFALHYLSSVTNRCFLCLQICFINIKYHAVFLLIFCIRTSRKEETKRNKKNSNFLHLFSHIKASFVLLYGHLISQQKITSTFSSSSNSLKGKKSSHP